MTSGKGMGKLMLETLLRRGGSLRVRIMGEASVRFMNLCASKGITLKGVERSEEGVEFQLSLADYYDIRPFVRKTKIKVVLLEKHGLPFFMHKYRKRSMFLLAAIMAAFFWIASSRFLWSVELEGNAKVTESQIRHFLLQNKITYGMPLSRIGLSDLEKELRREFPEITWASITVFGTRMTIAVKENEVEEEAREEHIGMDLVSPSDGRIVSMVVRSGRPMVKVGEEVKMGEPLISGRLPILREDGTVKQWMETDADGEVILERKRSVEEALSFYHLEEQKTGRSKMTRYLIMGNKPVLRVNERAFYDEYRLEWEDTPQMLKVLGIPVRTRRVLEIEILPVLRKYGENDVRKLLNEKLLRFLETLEEKGVQIIEKNVKIDFEGDFGLLLGDITTWEKADLFQYNAEGTLTGHDGH